VDSIIKCHHLHTLHICIARNISNVGLMKITQLQNLMSLVITFAVLIRTTWIELMNKSSLSHLRHLKRFMCCTLNDEVLTVMKINCQHLKGLTLTSCHNIVERDKTNSERAFMRLKMLTFFPSYMYLDQLHFGTLFILSVLYLIFHKHCKFHSN